MRCFRAMNTDVTIVAPTLAARDEAALADQVAARFAAAEQRFSRFRCDSELSRLNRATGPVVVSPELFAALVRARVYVELTDGIFDPGVGAALVALGYDRSFVRGRLDRPAGGPVAAAASLLEVTLDRATCTVSRPAHVQIDLGGMIKGHTVDQAARLLPAVAALDAGGDAVLRGAGARGDGWRVDVEDPHDPARTLVTLRVRDRAVATSAPNRRRWRHGQAQVHHLVDPRTMWSGGSDIAQATVLAGHAELAEVLAKTAFLLGAGAAARYLRGVAACAGAVLVDHAGGVELIGDVEVVADDDAAEDEACDA